MEKTRMFSVRIPVESHLYLAAIAERTERTVSEVAQMLLSPGGHQTTPEKTDEPQTEILALLVEISARLDALESAKETEKPAGDFSPIIARIDRQERAADALNDGLHAILDLLEKQATRPQPSQPAAAPAAPDFKRFMGTQPSVSGESFPEREARLREEYFKRYGVYPS